MNYPLIKPSYYFSLFKEILDFIKNPKLGNTDKKSTKAKIYDTIGLYILKMICLIPLVLFFALVYDPVNVQGVKMAERFTPLMLLVVAGFILPLVEETAFRLSLKFKPLYLALSVSVFVYYFLTKLVFGTKISAVDETFAWRVGVSVILGIVAFGPMNFRAVKKFLEHSWQKHFRIIYYVSCITFAWIHISKYEVNTLNLILLPILTLPQLMSAIINGYTRVNFGFQYPLIFHMANNFVGVGLSLLPFSDLIH